MFCLSFLCFALFARAQSGNENKVPVQEISAESPKDEVKKTPAAYEYISPRHVYLFIQALKKAGERGYRLDRMTSLPSSVTGADEEGSVLAGFVKYDGERRFDYNFFYAEGEKDPELTLNRYAKDGWAFREIITLADAVQINNVNIPQMGNIYLLERAGGEKILRTYKLLKGGVGTGRNPTAKLQGLMDQALAENFYPVASYQTFHLKNIFSVDAFCGILLEKRDEAKKLDYRFVRGNSSKGLWKDLDVAAKEGFHIDSMSAVTAIMTREPGATAPVSYTWLLPDEKTYQANLAATLAKNSRLHSVAVYSYYLSGMIRNLLVFENSAPPESREIKLVKMIPLIPKEFRKKPDEFLKTIDSPEIVFQKALDEGFKPKEVYYIDDQGLMAVFTREKKQ